jgi:hypothetical protein
MPRFDRSRDDVGNVIHLEHVNTKVPDPLLATVFYVSGLGLTRDPYLMTGIDNMWVNVGQSQFHLPTGPAQVLRGTVGLVLPDLASLSRRLESVASRLAGTAFRFDVAPEGIAVTSPWGNRIFCHAPDPAFGPFQLAMPYVRFEVPEGTAEGIAAFYREIIGTWARVRKEEGGRVAEVGAGIWQTLRFAETSSPLPPYDGHHVQIYLADFSGPHRKLAQRGLISEESDAHQYRFVAIVDPGSGDLLFEIEHEVRSLRHPLFGRPLVNRDPRQSNIDYHPDHDALSPFSGR